MDLGVITSYVIAGMIFLAITMMTLSLSQSTTELTLNQNARQNVQSVAEMLNYDIPKIGYNKIEKIGIGSIDSATTNRITFKSNIDNSGDESIETVTWEFTGKPVSASENPNDYVLKRTQNWGQADQDITEITLGVTSFTIRYYSGYGQTKAEAMATPVTGTDLDDIRQIEIEFESESPAAIGNRAGGDRYLRSAWEKRYSPGNLED